MSETRDIVNQAVARVTNITPSVISLAQTAGVTPEAFAKALANTDGNAEYVGELTGAYIKEVVKARKAEKASSSRSR